MTTNVIMPQMGESVFEGTLTKWLKKVGDRVTRDEPLFEISTDKVDTEIPSPASGILSAILVPEGKTIQINTILAIIDESDSVSIEQEPAAIPSKGEMALDNIPVVPPEFSQIASTLAREIETPVPLPTPAGKTLLSPETTSGIRMQDIRTSPLVRRLARENNVDLAKVQGTGLEGRITKDDFFAYLAQRSTSEIFPTRAELIPKKEPPAAGPSISPKESLPIAERPAAAGSGSIEEPRYSGDSEIIAMSPMRKLIAEHMVQSKKTSAHVSTVFEVDVSALVHLREMHKAEFEKREGVPLTYTPFFAKALVDTVREYPLFNSSIAGESIVYKKPIHLGVAVALDSGLIVPVVRDAHLKSFTGLVLAIHDLAERSRNKKLKPDDVKNGTISITNPGSSGALFATPIINQPQVAILHIGSIEKRPVVINDAIAIRSMVCLSLTFDHRVIDGAVADRFMARLKERLQSWIRWSD
jgi:pyruvate dehydrogenase E2 component (dihydrolipoamide acetyltransferase)